MRLSVTPIGSARLSAGQIATAVVEYLAGVQDQPAVLTGPEPPGPTDDATAGYYADSIEGPGRWLGRGSARLGLAGVVDRGAFARVLQGRDPATGERLLSARGSAERRDLAVGQPTRRAEDGEWLYDPRDAAKALGLSVGQVDELIARGDTEPDDGLPVLIAERDADGRRWVRDSELERFATERPSPETIAASGDPADVLDTALAAALLGVSPQYVRSCCRYWETRQRHIESLLAADLRPGRAWMVSTRADDGRPRYEITRAQVAAFAARRVAPVVRVGYDLTLSTEKSVAVAALLDGGENGRRVLAAIDAANDTAMAYLDRHASSARRQGERVGSEGLVVASFLHGTSRALDPFPHRHNVAANAVVAETGDRRALDARALYRHAPAAAALATAELRWRLTRDLGVRWRRSPRGVWEIDGIPDAVIREFSQRRDEIDAALAELAEAMNRPIAPSEVDTVVLATRAAKARIAVEDLRAGWRRRARRHGLGPDALQRCFGQQRAIPRERLTSAEEDRLHAWLCDRIVEEHAVFAHGDVVRSICDWADDDGALVVLPPAEVLRQAVRFLASHRVVELRDAGAARHALHRRRDGRVVDMSGGDPVFATVALLELEQAILHAFAAGADAGAAVVPEGTLEATPGFELLSPTQQAFARSLSSSGMAIQCGIGHPGSGKTHTVGVAARAWAASGARVVGAAVKGEAARVLAEATSVPTETVAWWLTSLRCGRERWNDRTVVLVDEASTLGTRDLAELVTHARRCGATVRLIGDPNQHGAVGAGGMFALLARRQHEVPELDENRRQMGEVDRFAAAAVRAGHVGEALAALKRAGQLTEVERPEDVYVAMLTRWLAARDAGEAHPMIDRRNGTRRVLNALAHRLLQNEGAVERHGLRTADGLEFCIGDEVTARRPDRSLHPPGHRERYVRNGSRGRVTAVHLGEATGLTVAFDDLGEIRLPRSFIERSNDGKRSDVGLDYGYALTSYAVQGATLPVSSSAITAGGRRRELYVNITRGRRDNHVFVSAPADPAGGEGHLPRPPEGDVVAEVLAAVGRPDEQRCAHALDPLALAAAHVRRGRSLPELDALGDGDAAAERATELEAAAIARVAAVETPAWILDALPPKPTVPWLAEWWDAAAGILAIEAARRGTTALESNHAAVAEARQKVWRAHLRRALADHATASGRPIACLGRDFAGAAIAAVAASPHPARIDVAELFTLLADTDDYRRRHEVASGDGDPRDALGPRPSQRGAHRQWLVLTRRWSLLHQQVGRDAPSMAR